MKIGTRQVLSLSRLNWTGAWRGWLVLVVLAALVWGCSSDEQSRLRVGDPAPSFAIQDLDGRVFSLDDYQGHPVLIRFFLPDCQYCRADTPVFSRFYQRYREAGLGVLYVETQGIDPGELEQFRKRLAIPFPVAQDRDRRVATAYNVKALPMTVVLDPEHRIVSAILGGISEAELAEILAPWLGGRPRTEAGKETATNGGGTAAR